MESPPAWDLEESLLLHLLDHRGHQVRFEADQWTTEFGIFRAFGESDQGRVKNALRSLEMSRTIYRRVQYVIGYSEPKLVYSLTPSGHRKALGLRRRAQGLPEIPEDHPSYASAPEDPSTAPDTSSLPPIRD
jgi:hypothetical protein